MEEKISKEFEENLKSLDLVNNSLEHDKKKLIIMVRVKGNKAVFKIYEKDRIWLNIFEYKQFTEYKSALGFDGNWQSFFKTLSLAIQRESGGDMQLKYPKTNKV